MKNQILAPITAITAVSFILASSVSAAQPRTKVVTGSAKIKTVKKAKSPTASKNKKTDAEISQEIAMLAAEIENETNVLKKNTSKASQIDTQTSISAETADAAKNDVKFNSAVNFTIGSDDNIDPDKNNIKDNFFEINPTLDFRGQIFSGTVAAAVRDYAKQETSDIAKKTTANADLNMDLSVSNSLKSVTSVGAKYNDEKWPDFIDEDNDGLMDGMPIRYLQTGLSQRLIYDTASMNAEIGGSYMKRDYTNLYSDYANDLLGEYRYEQDYNEAKFFTRVAYKANANFEIAARPSVTQKKYEERNGRLSDGHVGGLALKTPNYELITSEFATDAIFKFAGSNITPTALVGQVSDEALGAENNNFYGFGLSASIMLNKDRNLVITQSALYKRITYENWTKDTNGEFFDEKRIDTDMTGSLAISMDITKNFAAKLAYEVTDEESNMGLRLDENYKQQVIGTTFTLKF
jgi:hypothetical protein